MLSAVASMVTDLQLLRGLRMVQLNAGYGVDAHPQGWQWHEL
jgi:hypothetical protein